MLAGPQQVLEREAVITEDLRKTCSSLAGVEVVPECCSPLGIFEGGSSEFISKRESGSRPESARVAAGLVILPFVRMTLSALCAPDKGRYVRRNGTKADVLITSRGGRPCGIVHGWRGAVISSHPHQHTGRADEQSNGADEIHGAF